MSQPSPYTPGVVANEVPGRAAQLGFYRERAQYLSVLGGFAGRITVYYAARGIGKTSLLRSAQRLFSANRIQTVWITANENENLLATLLSELRSVCPAGSKARKAIVSATDSITVGVGTSGTGVKATLKPDSGEASQTSVLKRALIEAADAVRRVGDQGLVILIDEIQSADQPSLRALAHAWQELATFERPLSLGLFAVGLPGSQEYINKAVTFSERYDFRNLPDLDEGGVAAALTEPAFRLGVEWDVAALNAAVRAAERYPYKVQLIGDEVWRAAQFPDPGAIITVADLNAALPEVNRQMRSLFAARWRSASKKQRELLTAIARLGGKEVRRDKVSDLLGVKTGTISVPRDRLLRTGVIEATDRGLMSFTGSS